MFVIESGGKPACVVIKATLAGNKYKNEWLDRPNRLKYFLKSRRTGDLEIFGEHFKPNAAILENQEIPIVTFVRQSKSDAFTYQGVFTFFNIHRLADDSKWFELVLSTEQLNETLADAQYVIKTFEEKVLKSLVGDREARLRRLSLSPETPPSRTRVVTYDFHRSADVVAEVLFRANGCCESCLKGAPFISRSKGMPYLEVHHRLPLAQGGLDRVENAVALCPNCHRQDHFG